MSRILLFVRTARALLWMQFAAAIVACVLGVWAFVAVRELAIERDALLAQNAELRRGLPVAAPLATPDGPVQTPLDTEARAPAIMPVFVPIIQGADVPEIPPVDIPSADNGTAPPAPGTPPEQDCTGANANQARCRPGRWSRRDPPVVTQPVPQPRDQPPPAEASPPR